MLYHYWGAKIKGKLTFQKHICPSWAKQNGSPGQGYCPKSLLFSPNKKSAYLNGL